MAINTFSGGNFINSLQAAGKNAVINGGMDIWQRGTSFTVASSTQTYTTDRWMAYRIATGATVTRQNTSPNYSPYYVRVARDSGNTSTNIIYLTQAIETLNSKPLAGKTITLSWWARAGANYSSTSNLMTWELAYGTGTDQNMISGFTGQTNITAGTKTLTTSWQQFTTTGTVSTSATQIGLNFYYTPTGTAGAADYMEIADVQLELGSTATTFSRAGGTIQGELAACQRYYWRNSTTSGTYGLGVATSTTASRYLINFPVSMRVSPTSLEYGTGVNATDMATYNYAFTALTLNSPTLVGTRLDGTVASGQTAFRPQAIFGTGGTDYIGFNAEL
jgi:hypothetical protein